MNLYNEVYSMVKKKFPRIDEATENFAEIQRLTNCNTNGYLRTLMYYLYSDNKEEYELHKMLTWTMSYLYDADDYLESKGLGRRVTYKSATGENEFKEDYQRALDLEFLSGDMRVIAHAMRVAEREEKEKEKKKEQKNGSQTRNQIENKYKARRQEFRVVK